MHGCGSGASVAVGFRACELRGFRWLACFLRASGLGLQVLRASGLSGFRVAGLQGCRASGLWASGLQVSGLRASGLRASGLRASGFAGFGVAGFRVCGLRGCGLQGCGLRGCGLRGCGLPGCGLQGYGASGLRASGLRASGLGPRGCGFEGCGLQWLLPGCAWECRLRASVFLWLRISVGLGFRVAGLIRASVFSCCSVADCRVCGESGSDLQLIWKPPKQIYATMFRNEQFGQNQTNTFRHATHTFRHATHTFRHAPHGSVSGLILVGVAQAATCFASEHALWCS